MNSPDGFNSNKKIPQVPKYKKKKNLGAKATSIKRSGAAYVLALQIALDKHI